MTLDRFQSIDPALLDIHPHDRVIDLGCGTGRHVLELAKGDRAIIGADLSSHDLRVGRYLLEIMRQRGEVKAHVHWLQTAGEHLPFIDGAFDRVICTETLEHVDDDRVLAAELARVLKPGGILAISVPDEYSERMFWKLSKNYRTHAGGHVRIYARRAILDLLRGAGFRPYAVRYRHALETMYWLSHVALWSDWGKQGPITRVLRRWLDSQWARESRIVTGLDDLGNRILPKSIVVYSFKTVAGNGHLRMHHGLPLAPVTLAEEATGGAAEHLVGVAPTHVDGGDGHRAAEDERSEVVVKAVPAPFPVPPAAEKRERRAAAKPLTLTEELRRTLDLSDEERKKRLLELLRSARFAVVRELQDLTGEQASAPWTPDGRTLKEIVGHMTAWEQWTIAALDEIAEGSEEPAIMSLAGYPVGIARYASIDAFNAARMAEARDDTWSALLERSDTIFELLIAAVERTPAGALSATSPFFWPDLGGTVPCGVYLLMVSAHHYQEEHLAEIVRK